MTRTGLSAASRPALTDRAAFGVSDYPNLYWRHLGSIWSYYHGRSVQSLSLRCRVPIDVIFSASRCQLPARPKRSIKSVLELGCEYHEGLKVAASSGGSPSHRPRRPLASCMSDTSGRAA
jgi:hypothetical protein